MRALTLVGTACFTPLNLLLTALLPAARFGMVRAVAGHSTSMTELELRDNLGGKIGNMIMYPGYCVLGFILFSYLCRYLFCCWAAGLAKRRYASGQRPKFANRKPLAEDPLRDEPVVPILLRAAAAKADTYTYTMARGSGGVAPSPPPRHSGSGVAAGAERVKPPWEMRLKAEQTEADETGVSGRRGPYPNMLGAA